MQICVASCADIRDLLCRYPWPLAYVQATSAPKSHFNMTLIIYLVDCGNPVVIQHGNVVYSTTTLDSVATYTCEDGFLIAGSSKPICQANASWTSVPECNPVGMYF